ncbi:MAG: hypothetical protein N2257_06460 [Thermodesulfovibrionales bacterium]|nr:hypothetical protein [Thermodesulfovibrionales bacterium]
MIPFYKYLRKSLYFHIASGFILGLIAGVLVFTDNYKKILTQSILSVRAELSTAQSIREEDELLKRKIEILRALLPEGYRDSESEVFILEKLDNVKSLFPTSKLTVTEFQTEGEIISTMFTLQGSIENWREFVNKIALLESPGLPSLYIDKLIINLQADGSNTFQISGRIKAARFNP